MAQSPLNQARDGEKLTRLMKNKDFKELILDGFLHDFALEMSCPRRSFTSRRMARARIGAFLPE